MPTIPATEPSRVVAGDAVAWTKTLADYPASAGYVLTYTLAGGGSKITIAATPSGDNFAVSVASATTANWKPGDYVWFSAVTLDGERTTLDSGALTVAPDPQSMLSSADLRSHARKVLDAVEAVIEGRASMDQQEMIIAGDRLVRHSVESLLALRSQYKAEVAREIAAERIAKGLDSGGRVLVRFR